MSAGFADDSGCAEEPDEGAHDEFEKDVADCLDGPAPRPVRG